MVTIDTSRLAEILLPTPLRKGLLLAYTKLVLNPVQYVHDLFSVYVGDTDFDLTHNSQSCSIADALNKRFGYTADDGFVVTDGNIEGNWVYAYKEDGEEDMVFVTDEAPVLCSEGTINTTRGENFFVVCPSDFKDENKRTEASALIGHLRLVCKTYKLI